MKKCLNCNIRKVERNSRKYCSHTCQHQYNEKQVFLSIENDTFEYKNDLTNRRWFKRYLISRYGEKCMNCNWCERNPYSGNIPIELEHCDGNYNNFALDNLKLLCPNCHSLTPTYKAMNKGNGREYRRKLLAA